MDQKNLPINQTTTVLRSFNKIQSQFGKWGQVSIVKNEMTMPQFWIMQMLRSGQMIPQKQIGERTLFPKSTLSSSIDGLVSSGLVNRIILEENRREVQLQLTKAGEKKIQLLRDDPNGVFQNMNRVLAQLPPESIETLLAIHQKIYELMIREESSHNGGEPGC